MSNEPAAAPAAPKKKSRLLILLTAALVLILGGGGGAYWMLYARPAADPAGAAAHATAPEARKGDGVVALAPFVVNLADAGGATFLRVNLALVVDEEAHAKEITENAMLTMRMRSAILEHLATQSGAVLVTPEGKDALKKTIVERLKKVAADADVSDVLFSEFVVQF